MGGEDGAAGTRGPASDNDFCLELITPRSKVLLGEPVVAVVSLENCSSQERQVRELLSPEFGLLSVWIQGPEDSEEHLYNPPVRRDGRGKTSVSLDPGEQLTAQIPVYFARDGWRLTRPGRYRLRAEYPVGKGAIFSEPVDLIVESPATAKDRTAAEFFMAPQASRFFFLGGSNTDTEGLRQLSRLAEEYEGTPWSAYAHLSLAISDALDAGRATRGSDCDQLSHALGAVEDPLLAADGVVALIRCLRRVDRGGEARQSVDSYFEIFPDARTIPGLASRLEREVGTLR